VLPPFGELRFGDPPFFIRGVGEILNAFEQSRSCLKIISRLQPKPLIFIRNTKITTLASNFLV
jgi:hypothetical protein